MTSIPDPLYEKQKNVAATLNRRRLSASQTSQEIIARREAFFDRLTLLNAGALTFSVTQLGNLGARGSGSSPYLYCAWGFLLLAIAACLVRNLSHQHYQMADVMTKMSESEIAYIDVDYEIVNTRTVMYSDSVEPFDKNAEIALNRSNRETWKSELVKHENRLRRNWAFVNGAEWVAGSAMVLAFGLLIAFAILNLGFTKSLPIVNSGGRPF
jgi:hypothetical protein